MSGSARHPAWGDDIVCSAWEHAAGVIPGLWLTPTIEHKVQYGSSAAGMAKQNKVDKSVAEGFIANYYNRYKKVKQWQDDTIAAVKRNAQPSAHRTPKGNYPARQSDITSETGRIYRFIEGDAPDFMMERGTHTSFKPTLIKNYPIQGGATGDIVPMMLGQVNRWLMSHKDYRTEGSSYDDYPNFCLINTVHDSIMLDTKPEYLYTISIGVRDLLLQTPMYYEEQFDVEFKMPTKVDVECGQTWGSMYYKLEVVPEGFPLDEMFVNQKTREILTEDDLEIK